MRGILASLALAFGASVGVAQDMPLFTFAKLGAKWEKIGGVIEFVPIPAPKAPMTCAALTLDGSTLFAGYADRSAIWGYPVKKDGEPDLTAGAPYAPLRIVEGYDNSREAREKRKTSPPTLAVTALAVDTAGRLYAGTSQGIQVFDPTGRLCGTLPLPKPGEVRGLEWRKTPTRSLILDMAGTVYVREMK